MNDEQNATNEEMQEALNKGYIKNWTTKNEQSDSSVLLSRGIEAMYRQIGAGS